MRQTIMLCTYENNFNATTCFFCLQRSGLCKRIQTASSTFNWLAYRARQRTEKLKSSYTCRHLGWDNKWRKTADFLRSQSPSDSSSPTTATSSSVSSPNSSSVSSSVSFSSSTLIGPRLVWRCLTSVRWRNSTKKVTQSTFKDLDDQRLIIQWIITVLEIKHRRGHWEHKI